jgi:hypothetical protein
MNVKLRQSIERRIARRLVSDILAAGHAISIDETQEHPSANRTEILGNLFQMDEDQIHVHRAGEAKPFAWVFLVYGNDGWDVISDYTTNIEALVSGANAAAEKLEGIFA